MADDELNSTESTPTDETANHNPPKVDELGQSEVSQATVTELESLLVQKDEELSLANSRVTELEQTLAESDKKLTDTSNALFQAIASYKTLIIKSNPGVIEELIIGDNIEDINASLEKAKTLIVRVRKGLEEEVAATRVPAGAPQRTPPDLSVLSPREKIQYAIGGKK